MVGFSDLSDTDESAIDEIISQAQDACVLEQVSAINCSSFTDSALPSDLESRFRKLKSFPVTKPKRSATPPPPYYAKGDNFSTIDSRTLHHSVKGDPEPNSPSHEQSFNFSSSKENPPGKICLEPKMGSGFVSSPSDSLDFSPVKENSNGKMEVKAKSKYGSVSPRSGSSSTSEESSISSQFKRKPDEGKRSSIHKSKSGSVFSPLSSSNSLMDSPSPPRKAGCFWCSPKKDSKKKSKEDWGLANVVGWDKGDIFLSDLGSFSSKQQQKLLKKAMKEEEKISREAEKIVEWAKQASARMSVSGIDDELSDD